MFPCLEKQGGGNGPFMDDPEKEPVMGSFFCLLKLFSYICEMEKVLIICRGIPGSGKSTFAKTLGGQHYEADMYFVTPSGKYEFEPTKIREAHEWCQDLVYMDMVKSEPVIVVSNTFTQEWEMKPYFNMAKEYGYIVFTIVVENRHGGTNTHNVPEEKIEQMKNRFSIKL